MSTTWDEASQCPVDGTTGKVVQRKRTMEGQLVTLECQQTRCSYHDIGWVVQIRPDNTIPDPVIREKQSVDLGLVKARRNSLMANLEKQLEDETKPGGEVSNLR